MQVKLTIDKVGNYTMHFVNGEVINISKYDIPHTLKLGGEAELIMVPLGEAVDQNQARLLLNELLDVEI
jgi:hypothetical protein